MVGRSPLELPMNKVNLKRKARAVPTHSGFVDSNCKLATAEPCSSFVEGLPRLRSWERCFGLLPLLGRILLWILGRRRKRWQWQQWGKQPSWCWQSFHKNWACHCDTNIWSPRRPWCLQLSFKWPVRWRRRSRPSWTWLASRRTSSNRSASAGPRTSESLPSSTRLSRRKNQTTSPLLRR